MRTHEIEALREEIATVVARFLMCSPDAGLVQRITEALIEGPLASWVYADPQE